ncbi:hypothetical protein L195_g017697 [Trifolium pratense]|uniref:Uncharacterized protein n=1 Tax=Trifolium pratense TaxID=57577 RepID=A0A2K3MUM0_TRIPR|nr:hypothetical protein L195_g017697 [Trifolium pratense]
MVAKVWRDQTFSGLMGFVLKERLKGLKSAIKEWKLDMYGKLEEKKKELVAGILALDNKSEVVGLTQLEVASRKKMFEDLWAILKSIDASIFH